MQYYSQQVLLLSAIILFGAVFTGAQEQSTKYSDSLEVSEKTGVPVILLNLPDYQNVKGEAKYSRNKEAVTQNIGNREALNSFEMTDDAEAASASYPNGTLLIIEFGTPQASVEADNKIKAYIATNGTPDFVYKRIGNYNAFVFDPPNPEAGNELLSRVKYQKLVQWLNGDPYARSRAERGFVIQTKNLFFSTVLAILLGLLFALLMGIIAGLLFYAYRQRERQKWTTFSDGGGLTRLNLDSLTTEIPDGGFYKKLN
ncbi:MAG: hypothetical protein ACK5NT_03400 [Pyrinomonadaceae bacterium]